MKGKHVLLVLALLALPAAAPAQTGSCTVTIDPDSVVLPWNATGGSFLVQNDAACFWKLTGVEQQGSWLTPQSYEWSLLEDTGVNYSVTQNTGPERTANIAIDAYGVYTVVQEAQPCGVFRSENALTGSPTDGVYVANTDCGKVVNVDNGDPGWTYTVAHSGTHYEGLLYGPDGLLYALDTAAGKIVRFAPGDAAPTDVHSFAPPVGPRLAAFNNRGDLIVVDDSSVGLRYLHNSSSIGADLAFDADADLIPGSFDLGRFSDVITLADGDLLAATSAGDIYRFPFHPSPEMPYDPPGDPVQSVSGATAITRAANGTVFIAAGNTIDTYAFDEAGDLAPLDPLEPSCATFGDAATIADMDVSADDTLYVTTLTPDAITSDNQGELWQIPYYTYTNGTAAFGCQAKSLLATFTPPSADDENTPLVGVAVPFTTRDGKPDPTLPEGVTVPEGSQLFNFFDSLYEFRPPEGSTCTIDVTAEEYSPSTVQGLLADAGYPDGRPITFYGDNGRTLGYRYEAQDEAQCPSSVLYEHAINAYYSGLNPQIMVCEDPADGDSCRVITFQTYFSGVGFFPDDGRIGGTNPTFSTTFLVDLQSGVTQYWGDFCGYQSPLSTVDEWNEGVIPLATDPLVPVFQAGSDMPVKFTVADTDPAVGGSCKNGPYVTEDLTAVLSIARIDPVHRTILEVIHHIDITGGGSYDDGTDRIVFDDPNNKNKPFALQIKLSQNGVPLTAGLYQVVVTDDTANTDGIDKYYFPAQTTYFAVK